MKKALVVILLLLVLAAVAAFSFFKGIDKVRDGLIANYPTVKNVIQGATTEFFDSLLTVRINSTENPELFAMLKGTGQGDSLELVIPYYARYGVDLSVRNFRVFRDGQTVEVWIPDSKLIYCELKFERLMVNGQSTVASGGNYPVLRQKMYELLLPLLEKNKANQKAAKKTVAKAVMFYFMPYKFDLKLYFDNAFYPLPDVPGVNQTVDEAIKKMLGS
jgi:hypothetical protein